MNRRTFVRRGGETAAAVAALGTAGCSQVPLLDSGGGSNDWTAMDWVHEPGVFDEDRDHYRVEVYRPTEIAAHESTLGSDYVSAIDSNWLETLPFDVEMTTATAIVLTNATGILLGDFSRSDVAADLESTGATRSVSVGEFHVYDDEGRLWGVGPGVVIIPQIRLLTGSDSRSTIETAVDVGNGERDRYAEAVPAMDLLTETLADGFGRRLVTGPSDASEPLSNTTGRATGYRVADGEIVHQFVVVFERAADVDRETMRRYVDAEANGEFDTTTDVSVAVSGRTGTVEGVIPASEWYQL